MTPEQIAAARTGYTLFCTFTSVPFMLGILAGVLIHRRVLRLGWPWALLPAIVKTWYVSFEAYAQAVLKEESEDKN